VRVHTVRPDAQTEQNVPNHRKVTLCLGDGGLDGVDERVQRFSASVDSVLHCRRLLGQFRLCHRKTPPSGEAAVRLGTSKAYMLGGCTT